MPTETTVNCYRCCVAAFRFSHSTQSVMREPQITNPSSASSSSPQFDDSADDVRDRWAKNDGRSTPPSVGETLPHSSSTPRSLVPAFFYTQMPTDVQKHVNKPLKETENTRFIHWHQTGRHKTMAVFMFYLLTYFPGIIAYTAALASSQPDAWRKRKAVLSDFPTASLPACDSVSKS